MAKVVAPLAAKYRLIQVWGNHSPILAWSFLHKLMAEWLNVDRNLLAPKNLKMLKGMGDWAQALWFESLQYIVS